MEGYLAHLRDQNTRRVGHILTFVQISTFLPTAHCTQTGELEGFGKQ